MDERNYTFRHHWFWHWSRAYIRKPLDYWIRRPLPQKGKGKEKKKTVARFNLQQTGDYQQIFTESLLWAYGLRKKKKSHSSNNHTNDHIIANWNKCKEGKKEVDNKGKWFKIGEVRKKVFPKRRDEEIEIKKARRGLETGAKHSTQRAKSPSKSPVAGASPVWTRTCEGCEAEGQERAKSSRGGLDRRLWARAGILVPGRASFSKYSWLFLLVDLTIWNLELAYQINSKKSCWYFYWDRVNLTNKLGENWHLLMLSLPTKIIFFIFFPFVPGLYVS